MSSTHPYTCLTCNVAFGTTTLQRSHFASDVHKYNAKRKIANLPPVSLEAFNEQIAARRAQIAAATGETEAVRYRCEVCGKSFRSQNVYADHLNSKKHKDEAVRIATLDLSEGSASDESEDQEMSGQESGKESEPASKQLPESCLFCPRSFDSLPVNLKHMANNHAFHIPAAAYCLDVPGLLAYLADGIIEDHICIYCGQGFSGIEGSRKHMTDKSHCRIPWDDYAVRQDLAEFYDFGDDDSTAPAQEDEAMDGSNGNEAEEATLEEYRKFRTPFEREMDARLALGEKNYEVVLPSGQRIGHRALTSVYKQNLDAHVGDSNSQTSTTATVEGPANEVSARAQRRQAKSSALITTRPGEQAILARNAGEAREARKATIQFKEVKRYQHHFSRVAKVHNHQKHRTGGVPSSFNGGSG